MSTPQLRGELIASDPVSGAYTEDELNAIRGLYRAGQWYFDYVYVENSEGAHNSTMANDCLDKAADYTAHAMALFKKAQIHH